MGVSTLANDIQGCEVTFGNVSVNLGGVTILSGVSAVVPQGGCTAIVGPNGAGKTTLLMTLLNKVPYSGSVDIARHNDASPHRIGYVPQRLDFDRGMPLTVIEFLVMGTQKLPLFFGKRRKRVEEAMDLLKELHADELANRTLGALSGGELQRVLLALALQQNPELLILDEPAAGVDFKGEFIFCEVLEKLRRSLGFTQLMISHDLATVTHHATHVICLNRSVIAQGTPQDTLTPNNLTSLFGLHRGMLNARAMPNEEVGCAAECCHHEGE